MSMRNMISNLSPKNGANGHKHFKWFKLIMLEHWYSKQKEAKKKVHILVFAFSLSREI